MYNLDILCATGLKYMGGGYLHKTKKAQRIQGLGDNFTSLVFISERKDK